MPIRVLLLDADGVVQQPAPGWRETVASLCPEPGSVDAFLEELFAAERPCLTGAEDFEAALEGVLRRWRSPVPVADALAVWGRIEPHEGLLALVDHLRAQGLRVGLATNQQVFRAGIMSDALGYAERFDDLFFSCEVGHAKPGTEYFRAVLSALSVTGRETLFVDDHAANVAAARESGLNAELYEPGTGVDGMLALLTRHGIDYGTPGAGR